MAPKGTKTPLSRSFSYY